MKVRHASKIRFDNQPAASLPTRVKRASII